MKECFLHPIGLGWPEEVFKGETPQSDLVFREDCGCTVDSGGRHVAVGRPVTKLL